MYQMTEFEYMIFNFYYFRYSYYLWCGAKMWLGERVERSGSEGNVEFCLCCMKGKVNLPHLKKASELLYNLLHGNHPKSKHYLDNIRAYNSMFLFT